jgi:putative membrane-bound dehydrogenase-like protein
MSSMLFCAILSLSLADPSVEFPTINDDRLTLELFASEPDIVTPTGMAVDGRHRIFCVESHTHQPPDDYKGPKRDRIRLIVDTDNDGKADRFTNFFEGSFMTMNLALGPDGHLYVAERSEVFVLPDAVHLDVAKEKKTIVKLETTADYPHNGISGFTFDHDGNLWFGLGENLGREYSVVGTDGTRLSGGGEGGSVYTCRRDGTKLRRVATGFWNPFHVYWSPFGDLFAVDNDPDARPPCRLLHVVDGGNYGFKYRHGRNGIHPFHAWNGELPGTLPMVAGTGEAPCAVVGIEAPGWPADMQHDLLVTSWGDHRLERFKLESFGASYRSTLEPVITGGEMFRPVSIAFARPGELFFNDWVDKSYPVHGKGRIWRLKVKEGVGVVTPAEFKPVAPRESLRKVPVTPADLDKSVPPIARADSLRRSKEEDCLPAQKEALLDHDPFIRCAARYGLGNALTTEEVVDSFKKAVPPSRAEWLLILHDTGADPNLGFMKDALKGGDPDTQLVAVQWIGDHQLKQFRGDIEGMLTSKTHWTRTLFESTLATLDLLEHGKTTPEAGASFAIRFLEKNKIDPEAARFALRVIPPSNPWLTADRYKQLIASSQTALEAVRSLRESSIPERQKMLEEIIANRDQSDEVRAEAILGLASTPLDNDLSVFLVDVAEDGSSLVKQTVARLMERKQTTTQATKPPASATEDDLERVAALLVEHGDQKAGERLFFDPGGPGCYRCHQVSGRGGKAGPDLSTTGQNKNRRRLIESIVKPSQEIAPMYVPWSIITVDGRSQFGVLVREEVKGEQFYVGSDGKEFMLMPTDIDERHASRESIMPQGLLDRMTDGEKRDLITFLESLE